MKNAFQSKWIRSAVILGMAALLAFAAGGCGKNVPSGPSRDPAVSGESLVEIGPGIAVTESAAGKESTSAPETTTLPGSDPVTQSGTSSETAEAPETAAETAQESIPETGPEPTTEEPTAPEPTTEPAPETKPGLWAAVPTDSADWATRATSDVIYYLEDFGFTTYVSPYDRDGDGIEDQADILQGAKDYVATRPVYDTGYFAGGWPPAGRGVCSDVAAYALKAAGYDLQKLVDDDVKANPDIYGIAPGDNDPNIDYRRTRNLLPFFERYAEKLTLDPYDYEAWQPGDIVIFESPTKGMWPGHIAVVSDRRASDGLPYLIHHTDNDRFSYEQDFLTTPQRIIKGHYRVSGFQGAK